MACFQNVRQVVVPRKRWLGESSGAQGTMAMDLILKGGRIIDPSQHLDAVADIGFGGGKVAAIGPDLAAGAGAGGGGRGGPVGAPGPPAPPPPCPLGGTSARGAAGGV